MSKASHAQSTSTPNRRSILAGACGIAAAGTLMAAPANASASYSPEFLQWYAMAKTTAAVFEADNEWEGAHPRPSDEEREKAPLPTHYAALQALENVIFGRPVRSWSDVAELGMIALYWSDKDLLPGDRSDDPLQFALGRDPALESEYWAERPGAYLTQAVAKLAMGGVNV